MRDLFSTSTKSLDQFVRSGAFFHLVRRKATVADTRFHEFKDLQKTALASPLSSEGIFGPEFAQKLKVRQENDKQINEQRLTRNPLLKGNLHIHKKHLVLRDQEVQKTLITGHTNQTVTAPIIKDHTRDPSCPILGATRASLML